MGSILVKTVEDKKELDEFIQFSKRLYADCEQYVPDLDSDIRGMFDPKKNPGLEFSDVQPFIVYRDGKTAGRIVGIINHHANEKWRAKVVRFGYIDFIDDIDVTKALLDAVEVWGKAKGMNVIQGPLGITDFDKEGMLVEDFDKLGSVVSIYNYPYYPEHLEKLGYTKAVDWISIRVKIPEELPAKYARVSKLSKEMFHLHMKHVTLKDFKEGFGEKMFDLLNQAYSPLFGFSEMTKKQADAFVKEYLPFVDFDMLPIVENEEGEVIALAVTIGSLSHAMRKANGRLLPLGWYHLLKAIKWKREERVELLLIAVRPDYQGLGVNALLFDDLLPVYKRLGFKYAETGPQLEDNLKEISQWKPLNPEFTKRRRCYKKDL